MPNKNYIKGVALEREVVRAYREAGYQAARTAGSHSGADVVVWGKEVFGDILKGIGFIPLCIKDTFWYERISKKYTDKIWWVAHYHGVALLQCKRRKH